MVLNIHSTLNSISLLMITRLLMGFFQGWPTHQSVSIVNPAPTVQNRDLPAVPPALLIPSPTRVPRFAISVIEINMQVCMFTFLMPTRTSHIIGVILQPFRICMSPHTCKAIYMQIQRLLLTHVVKDCVRYRWILMWTVCFHTGLASFFTRGWFSELQTETCVYKQWLLLHPHSMWLWGKGNVETSVWRRRGQLRVNPGRDFTVQQPSGVTIRFL